ncbi:MAG: branched-chain amino acid ABC transporter permease [Candidatus Bathyarchaeia archaeon]
MVNWAQLLFNTLVTGSLYVLVALGLTMTYALLNYVNVSHAELITFGAYVGYTASDIAGLGLSWAFVTSFFFTGLIGVFSYLIVFRPLARRGGGFMVLCIASIGYGLVLRYAIQQAWGRKSLLYHVPFRGFNVGPIRMTWLWVSIATIAVVLVVLLHLMLTRTKLGKAMRATSNNPILARACGINTEKIMIVVWFLGSALAGIAGFFHGCETTVIPVLGWKMLIMGMAVVILGGIGSVYGTIAAAYLIGAAENLSLVPLGALNLSAEYKVIVGFAIIAIMLIFKPGGLAEIKMPKRAPKILPERKKLG